MSLGERIKEHRKKSRLSQEKVAELVGVSRQAVTKWETDQSAPNTENLFRLAEIFHTTVDALVSPGIANEPQSLAEQIHLLYRTEEQPHHAQRRKNLSITLAILAGYLVIFLGGKLFSPPLADTSITGWLFGTDPRSHSYLFGWLIYNYMFLFASLISAIPALFGKHRFSLTTLAGFALSLPLGEFLGRHPAGAPYGQSHYGWAIWLLLFLFSILMGIWLERFDKEAISFRSRRFILWCCLSLVGIVGILIFVRINMYP